MFGQGKGKGKGQASKGGDGVSATANRVFRFGEGDRNIIRDYYRGAAASSLPPGLAKRSSLPPGLEKQLAREGTLPPGLAKRVSPFPVELERRLPPLVPELRRGFIEGRAVIYNAQTKVILDIFLPF